MSLHAETDILTHAYESWSEGDRRGTRWLGGIIGAAGALFIVNLDVVELLTGDAYQAQSVFAAFLLVVGAALAIAGAFMSHTDSEVDLRYWLQQNAAEVADSIVDKDLKARTLPFSDFRGILAVSAPSVPDLSSGRAHAGPSLEAIVAGLPELLRVHQHLRSLYLQADESERPRLAIAVRQFDEAVEQLRARITFVATRARMVRYRVLIGGGALVGLVSIGALFFIRDMQIDVVATRSDRRAALNIDRPARVLVFPGTLDLDNIAASLRFKNHDHRCAGRRDVPMSGTAIGGFWDRPTVVLDAIAADAGRNLPACPPLLQTFSDPSTAVQPV